MHVMANAQFVTLRALERSYAFCQYPVSESQQSSMWSNFMLPVAGAEFFTDGYDIGC